MVDWDNLPESQVAAVCGRDPMMWAAAFCHAAKKIGVDLGDDPEGFVVGWFSAAMQAETDYMTPEQHEHEAREQRRVKCLHQMGDIVERLKQFGSDMGKVDRETCNEAAAEIERLRGVEQDAVEWVEERTKRLRAEIERLGAALEAACNHVEWLLRYVPKTGSSDAAGAAVNARDFLEKSRRALEANDD